MKWTYNDHMKIIGEVS